MPVHAFRFDKKWCPVVCEHSSTIERPNWHHCFVSSYLFEHIFVNVCLRHYWFRNVRFNYKVNLFCLNNFLNEFHVGFNAIFIESVRDTDIGMCLHILNTIFELIYLQYSIDAFFYLQLHVKRIFIQKLMISNF